MVQYTCWLILVDCFNEKCHGFLCTNPQLLKLCKCSLEGIVEGDKSLQSDELCDLFVSLFDIVQ
jgi:hypothetical protein